MVESQDEVAAMEEEEEQQRRRITRLARANLRPIHHNYVYLKANVF